MLKYLFAVFTLLTPVKIFNARDFAMYRSYSNQIVCIVPPLGNFLSHQTGRMIKNKMNPPGSTIETNRRNLS